MIQKSPDHDRVGSDRVADPGRTGADWRRRVPRPKFGAPTPAGARRFPDIREKTSVKSPDRAVSVRVRLYNT